MVEKKKRRLYIRTIILSVMVVAVAYTLYANFTKDKHAKLEIGDDAPDFVLTDMEGKKHQLSEYKGQGVFLNFWGTWCPPCKREMPDMDSQYQVYKDQGIEILAVNIGDTEFQINNFVNSHDLSFPILRDKTKDVKDMYRITNMPVTVLVDPDGKITQVEVGELTEAKIKGMMESIKPNS
ncbi:thiol-disulfide oxidoreductase ResA [Lederbergia lenta]|uniref:Cytochrome c biogenesis protein n=1 Tax=Lederbergia lenta TaxID=1467 RepID=A0A2X4W045_LEDLE|nr:thiol-disulfide oxidoreductase ResA [Lederbergia lenta]MCM3111578.1 thiol-disulfide oxidoreductase ResA [Lederbergia lenta]MEC2325034.1 thiol-disulfide oxidoreductase ResA [Lederbergia lenta]SQI56471.1 cytochrome c biogenesis protein [Lederbergia lenta]